MDNQHQKIAGYRDLAQDEIDLINEIKALEEHAASVFRKVEARADDSSIAEAGSAYRWADTGRTHLETGFMYLVKAVTRPTGGLGRA